MIHVEGAVTLDVDGAPARLTAEGPRVQLDAPEPGRLLRGGSRRALRTAAASATALGLTVRVTSRGRTLLVLGRDARPTLVSRLWRLGRVEVPLRAAPALARARSRRGERPR